MGNRFREMAGYHPLIRAHGVIATIVFLGFVPTSILIIRFYSQWDRYWAFKIHVWLQVLTLFLTTVVFLLGWFAVGPNRSLTNPHHGIGLAIYVMVIFQVLWGWLVHKTENGRKRFHVPLKLMVSRSASNLWIKRANSRQIHRWLGRTLAILGLVQIPLGLTLYGSPKSLFILYAVGAFILLVAFFVLSYLYDPDERRFNSDYDSRGSYISGPSVVEDNHHTNVGRLAAAGAAGAGLAKLFRRRSHSESRSRMYDDSSYTDEKYTEVSRRGGWKKKLLEICAIGGAIFLVKKLFERRRERESDTESGRYRPAHTRSDSITEETLSRAEEGRPEEERPGSSHHQPLNRPPSRPSSRDSMDYTPSSYFTNTDDRRDHGVRDGILGAGVFGAIRGLFKGRREREEQQRVDEIRRQESEEEQIARQNSKRKYSGDGYSPRKSRRASSYTGTEITSTDVTRTYDTSHGESLSSSEPVASGAVHQPPVDIPPTPPAHRDPPVSDVHAGRDTHQPRASDGAVTGDLAPIAPGAAAGAPASTAGSSYVSRRRRRSSSSRRRDENVVSPPVSVKVRMHNDGRHVTLRRLTDEEAAANREARRRERERRGARRRNTSVSSLSGNEGGSDRWRRVEEMERRQAEEIARQQQAAAGAPPAPPAPPAHGLAPSPAPPGSIPPSAAGPPNPSNLAPPPVPSTYGPGSITSPGTYTGTEASGDYASNRRRRRAERASARQARQHSVEFT